MKDIERSIFHAYDIRGLLEEVTEEVAEHVGAMLVRKLGAKTVAVGRDMRATSPALLEAAVRGITSQGARVKNIGMTTTSMFNFAVSAHDDIDAGLMVTASHNPAEYNGLKVARANGLPISGHDMLEWMDEEIASADVAGDVVEWHVLDAYLDACLRGVDKGAFADVKLVVDYGNGMGSVTFDPLLKRLGIQPVELYKDPDAHFPNHEANPAKEETLADIKAAMAREGADFGVALDGDADRIGFIDNEGVSVRGDLMLAVFARDVLARKPGAKIVVAPNHSWGATRAIAEAGGELVEERIGRTFVIDAMHKNGAALGGEISSHFFFEEFSNLESVDFAFVRALAIWKASGGTFADLVRPMRAFVNSGEVNLKVDDKESAMARVKEIYASQATSVNERDGIRCEFGSDWWFILRPSNTEPLLRLTVEGVSEELVNQKVGEIRGVITS